MNNYKKTNWIDLACYAMSFATIALLVWCVFFDAPHKVVAW